MNLLERFTSMVAANQFLTLSTSHGDEPWISPVYFAADKSYKLYFISRRDSKHAENIRSQPNVAVAIFNSTCTPGQCDGVQLSATARELDETSDVANGATVLFSRRFEDEEQRKKYLDPARYQGNEPMRIYEISPREIFVVDKERPNDYRVQVDL
jgi:uncharacterized protein YhbP (UPF0306 family)